MTHDLPVALHDWHVEEREYLRHEERRGRRFAHERLTPARTALVVVDMVPFFLSENPYARGIVPNIRALAAALREAGGLVAWVIPETTAEPTERAKRFYGRAAGAYGRSGGEGPLAGRFSPTLAPAEGEPIFEKRHYSAFFPGSCDLPSTLEARGVDTVLITGTLTNVCCESSARDAWTLGYDVIMVADGNAAVRDRDHNATLHTIYRSFGDVRPTEEVIGLIRRG